MKTTMKTIATAVALAASMGASAAGTASIQYITGSASHDGEAADVSGYSLKAEHDLNVFDSIVVSHQSLSFDVLNEASIGNEFTATDISYKTKLGNGLSTSFGIGQADGEVDYLFSGSESYTKFNISGDLMVDDGLTLNAGYNRYFADVDVNEFTVGADYSITRNLSVIATHEMASADYKDVDLNRTGLGMTVKF